MQPPLIAILNDFFFGVVTIHRAFKMSVIAVGILGWILQEHRDLHLIVISLS